MQETMKELASKALSPEHARGEPLGPEAANPLARQVGGGHYKGFTIQPVEFIQANNIPFLEGCIIKRACRWRAKAGVEDLRKIIHEAELLISFELARLGKAPTLSAKQGNASGLGEKRYFGNSNPQGLAWALEQGFSLWNPLSPRAIPAAPNAHCIVLTRDENFSAVPSPVSAFCWKHSEHKDSPNDVIAYKLFPNYEGEKK